jgi:hypothetical protein
MRQVGEPGGFGDDQAMQLEHARRKRGVQDQRAQVAQDLFESLSFGVRTTEASPGHFAHSCSATIAASAAFF